ncbi:MAG: NAD(P)H-dependent oxidoreductase [Succinivibrio sp.]|nr:NAD(P)H-dependent oxidoreductase [Succinivibrio sp.]
MSKILILYYSRRGENYMGGNIVKLAQGNTQKACLMLKDELEALGQEVTLFEVDTVKPYNADYHACTEEAKLELKEQARPKLKGLPPALTDYSQILVAGPCWWGTYPCAIFTALEHLQGSDAQGFAGKKVYGLMTHEGSGLGSSQRDLKRLCPSAQFGPALAVQGSRVDQSASQLKAFAAQLALDA